MIYRYMIFDNFKNNIYLFGRAGSLLLHRLFSSCDEQGLLSSCGVHGPLIVVASLVEHRLWSV